MADGKWFIRGVPAELVRQVTDTAKARGLTVGRLVTEVLRAALNGPLPAERTKPPAEEPESDASPEVEPTSPVEPAARWWAMEVAVASLRERVARLEEDRPSPRSAPRTRRPRPARGEVTDAPKPVPVVTDASRMVRQSDFAREHGVNRGQVTRWKTAGYLAMVGNLVNATASDTALAAKSLGRFRPGAGMADGEAPPRREGDAPPPTK